MVSLKGAEMVEDVAIIGGLICLQMIYAGNSILMSYLMSLGLNPLTIVIFSSLATFFVLSPIAFCLERKHWPERFGLKLITQMFLLAFGGVTLFQTIFLQGIKATSPAMATAMPNIAPGLIFIIAWTCKLEQVQISCVYSKVKILGTVLCVIGALTMSLMHSTVNEEKEVSYISVSDDPKTVFDSEKIIGSMYLFSAVFILACNVCLQATTLRDFPAPISLCAITSFLGVFTSGAVELLQDHRLDFGWPLVSPTKMICFSLVLGTISGVCVSFNGWAMKKRGPVFVSMFNPIATVISVILSAITIKDSIDTGSLAGMFLMFTGLYFVLWAKLKEDYSTTFASELDIEKPLLA